MSDELRVALPQKEPYEGRATQKQKQKLWDIGFRNQRLIDDLGKRQASVLIDAIISKQKRQTAVPLIVCGIAFLAIGSVVFYFYHGDRAGALSGFVGIVGIGCGGLMLLAGLVRGISS